MSGAAAAAAMQKQRILLASAEEFHQYFKERNAFTEETAVDLDIDTIRNKSKLAPVNVDPANFDFIKISPASGKYYFDQEGYQNYLDANKRGGKILFIAYFLIGLTVLLLFAWAFIRVTQIMGS